jgi:hypothetical protein
MRDDGSAPPQPPVDLSVVHGGNEPEPSPDSWSNVPTHGPLTVDMLLEVRDELRARALGMPILRDRR